MARAIATLLHSNSSRHRTIPSHLVAAKEAVVAAAKGAAAKEAVVAAANAAAAKGAVAAAPKGDSSNSAMAISVIPVSAATTVITDDADAISVDAADNVRRTDRAVEAVVVVAAAADKSRHRARRSLQ